MKETLQQPDDMVCHSRAEMAEVEPYVQLFLVALFVVGILFGVACTSVFGAKPHSPGHRSRGVNRYDEPDES